GIYQKLGDTKNAIKSYKECLNNKEDEEIALGSLINLGDIYSDQKDYQKADLYYNKANLLSEKQDNHQARAVIAMSLGANYQLLEKTKEALQMYQQAMTIADKNELNQIALLARGNIGDVYIHQKRYSDAKEIFYGALEKAISYG